MGGYVVWLTGDRRRMDALAPAVAKALAGTARSIDLLPAEMVEEKLCSNETKGADFADLVARRLGWLCHLLSRNDCGAIAVSASPKRSVRDEARKMAGGHMIEVVAGGKLPDGYEPPHYPEVEIPASEAPEAAAKRVREALAAAGMISETGNVYSAEDEARIKDRLEKLGYL